MQEIDGTEWIDSTEQDPLQAAIIKGGFEWEDKIVEKLVKEEGEANVVQPNESKALFTHSETVEILRTAKAGQYIFQASIEAPPSFYRNLDKELIVFSVSRPDFLQVLPSEDGLRR